MDRYLLAGIFPLVMLVKCAIFVKVAELIEIAKTLGFKNDYYLSMFQPAIVDCIIGVVTI